MSSLPTSLSQQARTNSLERIEAPAAALTLTRTSTLSIATTGTTITWQSATRNTGFTWSTTDITIPTAGYYALHVSLGTAANVTLFTQLVLNSTNLGYIGYTWSVINYHQTTHMRYFATNDVLQIRVIPSANTSITQTAETVNNLSPYLHIVQLTSAVL